MFIVGLHDILNNICSSTTNYIKCIVQFHFTSFSPHQCLYTLLLHLGEVIYLYICGYMLEFCKAPKFGWVYSSTKRSWEIVFLAVVTGILHSFKLGLLFWLASIVIYPDTRCIVIWSIVARSLSLSKLFLFFLSKRRYFIFNELILLDVMITLTIWHNSFGSFFKFQKLSYFKGTAIYGFLRRAVCITVSQICWMKMQVFFFASSFAACIE